MAQLASWLGSAQYFSEPRKEARLGSFQAREPLRAEPSRTEPEPRAFFTALAAVAERKAPPSPLCTVAGARQRGVPGWFGDLNGQQCPPDGAEEVLVPREQMERIFSLASREIK